MLRPATILTCLLLGAGCSTQPRRNIHHVPDWEREDVAFARTSSPPAAVEQKPVPSPAPSDSLAETWVPLGRWCRTVALPRPIQMAVAPLAAYALNNTNGMFIVRCGSQVAHWNGVEVRLGFAPQMIDEQPFVHSLDLRKTIEPLLVGNSLAFLKTNRVIVIDPGHGGEDSGTASVIEDRYEKEFTLDWARRLEALLAKNGWQVFLTRTNDIDLVLADRVIFAEQRRAGLFLSLHFNSAASDPSQAGLETYCLTPTGMASTVRREFEDDPAAVFPNNAYDIRNLLLAARVHHALLQVNGNPDRGVRRVRFPAVLRGQNRPAILIEGGYLSNPREAALIANPAHRQKLAEAVARALE